MLNPSSADLGTLANNGGPNEPTTPPETVALLSGSPALGSGGAATTLSAAVTTTTATSITVANDVFASNALPLLSTGSYFIIQIDGEQMAVTAVTPGSGTTATLTVTRGVNSTTAATHPANASVFLVSDERGDLPTYSSSAVVNMGAVENTPAPAR